MTHQKGINVERKEVHLLFNSKEKYEVSCKCTKKKSKIRFQLSSFEVNIHPRAGHECPVGK